MPARGPVLGALLAMSLSAAGVAGQDKAGPVDEAVAAYKAGRYKDAAALAEKAAAADPKDARAAFIAGSAYAQLRDNAAAAKAFSVALERNPKLTEAHDRRGDAFLKLGLFKAAVADFDVFLAAEPKDAADHWRRGIALYYVGRYDDGRKQFDLHRTVNPEDVENSVWHYLCNAKATNLKKAREDLIPVTKDTRVPMKEVLQMFAGKTTPADVLAAAEAGQLGDEPRLSGRFYANLYVALFYEAEGNAAKTREYLEAAVDRYKIGDYMWDVGHAHLEMLKKK
ncbi:MAG TPA: tetratricopeptide repeat protein [Urbifossiella sp.]|jgi:lipoprotein NlpI|nr:tetratricopeptide repeat protein [Urbifossiella sp.]